MKYRSKTMVVEAVQVPVPPESGTTEEYEAAKMKASLFPAKMTNAMPFAPIVHIFMDGSMKIGTWFTAQPGDWLVRYGKDGRLTVMDDELFQHVFVPVGNPHTSDIEKMEAALREVDNQFGPMAVTYSWVQTALDAVRAKLEGK